MSSTYDIKTELTKSLASLQKAMSHKRAVPAHLLKNTYR